MTRIGLLRLAAVSALFALPVQAQAPCTPDVTGPIPACMVGIWAGESDMAARLQAFLDSLPEDVRGMATTPAGQVLFLQVGAAGQYFASPLNQSAEATFAGEGGGSATLQVDVQTYGSTGRLYSAGGGPIVILRPVGWGKFTISGGGAASTGMLPAAGGAGAAPAMRYACGEGSLRIMVDTPAPMGTVTYDLRRIDEAALPAALRGLLPPAP